MLAQEINSMKAYDSNKQNVLGAASFVVAESLNDVARVANP